MDRTWLSYVKKLINELEKIPGIDVHLWKPDRDFMVIDYKGKELTHFHGNNELDIRLSLRWCAS